jgi:hypothetical protein
MLRAIAVIGGTGRRMMAVALAFLVSTAPGLSSPAAGAAEAEVRLPACGISTYGGSARPETWDRGCTGVVDLNQMTWQRWGEDLAAGTGVTQLNDCSPNCAEGTVEEVPVEAEVSVIRRCRDDKGLVDRFYTRIRMVYELREDNPYGRPGGRQEATHDLGCVSPDAALSCDPVGDTNLPGSAYDVKARGVGCARARRIVARAKRRACQRSCVATKTLRISGYRCRYGPFNSEQSYLPVRCAQGKQIVRFRIGID